MANTDWMSEFTDKGTLCLAHLTMPASHDAGVSEPKRKKKGLAPLHKSTDICQTFDINGQLTCGSRWLDMRFADRKGVPTSVHQTAGMGGWGEDVDSIFTAIRDFLHDHPTEIILVRISHTPSKVANNVHRYGLHILRKYLYIGEPNRNVTKLPLTLLRGKVLLLYDKAAIKMPNPKNGQIRFGKASDKDRSGIVTCGIYKSTKDMKVVFKAALEGAQKHIDICRAPLGNRDHLCQIYWQQTALSKGFIPRDIKKFTKKGEDKIHSTDFDSRMGTHYNLPHLLNALGGAYGGMAYKGTRYPGKNPTPHEVPNIINMDFVNDTVCSQIITFNRKKLEPLIG